MRKRAQNCTKHPSRSCRRSEASRLGLLPLGAARYAPIRATAPTRRADVRESRSDFVETIQADASSPVLSAKIFLFPPDPNQIYIPHVLPHKGAYRDRHGRGVGCGGRDGVGRAKALQGEMNLVSDARRANDPRRMRTAKPCGPGIRC